MSFKLTSIFEAHYLIDVGFEVIWNWVFSFCVINLSELHGLRWAQLPWACSMAFKGAPWS